MGLRRATSPPVRFFLLPVRRVIGFSLFLLVPPAVAGHGTITGGELPIFRRLFSPYFPRFPYALLGGSFPPLPFDRVSRYKTVESSPAFHLPPPPCKSLWTSESDGILHFSLTLVALPHTLYRFRSLSPFLFRKVVWHRYRPFSPVSALPRMISLGSTFPHSAFFPYSCQ